MRGAHPADFVGLSAPNFPTHGFLPFAAGKHDAPTDGSIHSGDIVEVVRLPQYHHCSETHGVGRKAIVFRRNLEPRGQWQESVPSPKSVGCAVRTSRRTSVRLSWVRAFSHLKRKCPTLRRIPKGPPPQRRSLRAAFFPSTFFAEAKKVDPQSRTFHAATIFQHFPNKNYLNPSVSCRNNIPIVSKQKPSPTAANAQKNITQSPAAANPPRLRLRPGPPRQRHSAPSPADRS